MKKRCPWCENSFDEYIRYHDEEWGVPVHDDQKHFEFLVLESAQAGLSWSTVLKKRESYRNAFEDFDPQKVAEFTELDVERLMNNEGIIRNLQKIRAAINNAQKFLEIQQQFGSFDEYIWSYVDGKPINNQWDEMSAIPARTKISDRLSKELKMRGFSFIGSTIIYAHMQAVGMVNDHITSCFRYTEVQKIQ